MTDFTIATARAYLAGLAVHNAKRNNQPYGKLMRKWRLATAEAARIGARNDRA